METKSFFSEIAQNIIDEGRHTALEVKSNENADWAAFRQWIDTNRGDSLFIEVVAFDFEVVYTFGPFVGEYGLHNSQWVGTSYTEAVNQLSEVLK